MVAEYLTVYLGENGRKCLRQLRQKRDHGTVGKPLTEAAVVRALILEAWEREIVQGPSA